MKREIVLTNTGLGLLTKNLKDSKKLKIQYIGKID